MTPLFSVILRPDGPGQGVRGQVRHHALPWCGMRDSAAARSSPRHPTASPARTTMPEFAFTELLPQGPDDTEYRLLTADGISVLDAGGRSFLQVEPEAL